MGQGPKPSRGEIASVKVGMAGEKQVRLELENSHVPMFTLHGQRLDCEGLFAQIDYLLFTRAKEFCIESKKLYGNVGAQKEASPRRRTV